MKVGQPMILVVCAPLISACDGNNSVLSPHGPAASSIAALTWMLFGITGAVFAIVVVATWLAIAGTSSVRARIAEQRSIVIGGVLFPTVVLSGLLIYGLWLMRADASAVDPGVKIEVSGEQWWWRVRYQLPEGRTVESANEIRLPVGRSVALNLSSPDVIHSLWIPSLAGKVDMIPGRSTSLRLKADRPGIYRGACAEYCGGPHALMALHAVAMSPADFDSWLARRLQPAPVLDESHQRGRKLFHAAGCGGCHAVEGTEARGSIGPDLSDLGLRQSIGAGTLPMSAENLSRFLVHSQRVKPGNKMPPFDVFNATELADLTSYLMSLR